VAVALKVGSIRIFKALFEEIFSWPRGLRCESAAFRVLGFRVQILPEHGCLPVVSVVSFHLEVLHRADRSSRGVLPHVVCLSVIMKPR
jgi:hypothetical protein